MPLPGDQATVSLKKVFGSLFSLHDPFSLTKKGKGVQSAHRDDIGERKPLDHVSIIGIGPEGNQGEKIFLKANCIRSELPYEQEWKNRRAVVEPRRSGTT
jgi:hypothetical protein